MHGDADLLVPVQMSDVIARQNSLVERHVFPGARHGMSFMSNETEYLNIVKEFIERNLK